jgi:hypothetical protein
LFPKTKLSKAPTPKEKKIYSGYKNAEWRISLNSNTIHEGCSHSVVRYCRPEGLNEESVATKSHSR